jgi:hypothetical protein
MAPEWSPRPGGLLLTRTLRVTGLDRGLEDVLKRWRPARAVHGPGKILTDLVVALALDGDCLADAATLRCEPELFGRSPRTRWSPGWWPAWLAMGRGR